MKIHPFLICSLIFIILIAGCKKDNDQLVDPENDGISGQVSGIWTKDMT